MRALPAVSLTCFVLGTAAFLRFFYLATRLRGERLDRPSNQLEAMLPWLPGQFTPEGDRIRRRMNRLLIAGWVFLVVGLFFSPR